MHLLPSASAPLIPASSRSRPGFCGPLRSTEVSAERAYLRLHVMEVFLSRVEVMLILAAVEAAVAADVTEKGPTYYFWMIFAASVKYAFCRRKNSASLFCKYKLRPLCPR